MQVCPLTAALLSEVCHDDEVHGIKLQPLSGENSNLHYRTAIYTDGARLIDVKTQGFWGVTNTKDYFDVEVFNPYAKSYKKGLLQKFFYVSTMTAYEVLLSLDFCM